MKLNFVSAQLLYQFPYHGPFWEGQEVDKNMVKNYALLSPDPI